MGKPTLALVFRCEGSHLADLSEGFTWSLHNAKGRLAHRAIEKRLVPGPFKVPLDKVDEEIRIVTPARLLEDFE